MIQIFRKIYINFPKNTQHTHTQAFLTQYAHLKTVIKTKHASTYTQRLRLMDSSHYFFISDAERVTRSTTLHHHTRKCTKIYMWERGSLCVCAFGCVHSGKLCLIRMFCGGVLVFVWGLFVHFHMVAM